ncbi:hypothetical protein HAX54_032660, partial [Datura stramonium]|nr:hypothetical protein [Datura stramonium]
MDLPPAILSVPCPQSSSMPFATHRAISKFRRCNPPSTPMSLPLSSQITHLPPS